MDISIFKKTTINKEQLDVAATYNLWELLLKWWSKALEFEVQLPERPPSSVATPLDPESLEDRCNRQVLLNKKQQIILNT